MPRPDRVKLLLLLGLFAAPALAAWIANRVWRPLPGEIYGELLRPMVPEFRGLTDASGNPADLTTLQGRWVLLVVAKGECGSDCREQLELAGQVRHAQGRDQVRVVQALLQADASAPVDLFSMHCYRVPGVDLANWPDPVRTYLVDPMGRVMLRFPARPEGKGMLHDLRQLLKASQIG